MFTLNNTFLRGKRLFENGKYQCGEKNHEDQYDTDSMDSQSLIRYMPKKILFGDLSKKKK